jgi:hypothetical protein
MSNDIWFLLTPSTTNVVPPKLYQHAAVILDDEEKSTALAVYGGEDETGYWSNNLFIYDLKDSQWRQFTWIKPRTASYPPKKDGHSMIKRKSDLFVFGGSDNQVLGGGNNFIYQLNVETMRWKTVEALGDAPTGRTLHSCCHDAAKDVFYVFGGRSTRVGKEERDVRTRQCFNDVYSFNLANCTWTKLNPRGEAPTPRCGQTMILDENRLYVFGGLTSDTKYQADIFELNLASMRWTRLECSGDLPAGRERHSAVLSQKDNHKQMIIYGGWVHGGASNQCYSLDMSTFKWSKLPTPTIQSSHQPEGLNTARIGDVDTRRYGHSAHLVNEGKQMLIFGGKNQYWHNLNTCLVFNITGETFSPPSTSASIISTISSKFPSQKTELTVDEVPPQSLQQQQQSIGSPVGKSRTPQSPRLAVSPQHFKEEDKESQEKKLKEQHAREEEEKRKRIEREEHDLAENQRLEKERLEKEIAEKEQAEKDRIEKERLKKESQEHARIEQERLEKERLAQQQQQQEQQQQQQQEQEQQHVQEHAKEGQVEKQQEYKLEEEEIKQKVEEQENEEKAKVSKHEEKVVQQKHEEEHVEKQRNNKEHSYHEQIEKDKQEKEKLEAQANEHAAMEQQKLDQEREKQLEKNEKQETIQIDQGIQERLKIVENKEKLLTMKKPAVKHSQKAKKEKSNITELAKSLEQEVIVVLPSDDKFEKLAEEAKRISEEVPSKKPVGGVNPFAMGGMGRGIDMKEMLAQKNKLQSKEQDK